MYMTRTRTTTNIRMFCPLGPRDLEAESWWPDVSYKYVCALRAAGLEPRVIPIGGMQLGGMTHVEHDRAWRHWKRMGDDGLFTRGLTARFVNIVCAPVGLEVGSNLTMRDFAKPPQVPGRDPAAGREDEVVCESTSALAALWTADMVNIAITGFTDESVAVQDVLALKKYSLVLCPTMRDVTELGRSEVDAKWYAPARFAVDAARMPCFAEVVDA
jgi:hypothetical protein